MNTSEAKFLKNPNSAETAGKLIAEFNKTFYYDRRLFFTEIRVSLAYCDALFQAGVLTRLESERIKNGLYTIAKRADFNENFFNEAQADNVYSFIEARLAQLIGEAGRKLSIGRSQYDQSATALRLWLREEIEEISESAKNLQAALIEAGERQREAVFPAYANLRKTQPILWAHWCLAFFEMLARDIERLEEVWRRVNVLPPCAANPAGTSFEIDSEAVARHLKFEGIAANSLDAVTDNDYCLEFAGASAILMTHLARLAGDLILYNTEEFNFIKFSDAVLSQTEFTKTPAALEVIRAKADEISGCQTTMFSIAKSLSPGTSRGSEQIKEMIFKTVDAIKSCLQIAAVFVRDLQVNETETRRAVSSLNAGELKVYLLQRDVPVKTADEIVGQIVEYAAARKRGFADLSLKEMQNFSQAIEADLFDALSLEQTLASKNQIGGTAPERVCEALEAARTNLERE